VLNVNSGYLIAEIGINHNGDPTTARMLIDAASTSGCNAIKFQYRNLDRAYTGSRLEIGDEILSKEIEQNFIGAKQINDLALYAKSLGLGAGISFFDVLDISDFGDSIQDFDFFKIPSVELGNRILIENLLNLKKFVFISTGASTELEIERVFQTLPAAGWLPLHCTSNYPTQQLNSKIGYIEHLRQRWSRPVGYSSHDQDWEICVLAIAAGARVIERHITLDKTAPGLDHTSSSTPDEFLKLSSILQNYSKIMGGDGPRYPNQGELINRQNLGKSYFAKMDLPIGTKVQEIDFDYRHPRVGLSSLDFIERIGQEVQVGLKKGNPLTSYHFSNRSKISEHVIEKCNLNKISLPIRLHDYAEISERFPLDNFELHLSFGEIDRLNEFAPLSKNHKISIHFPDYISSSNLFNPFSIIKSVSEESFRVINSITEFSNKLSDLTEQKITSVSSVSQLADNKAGFYSKCASLQSSLESDSFSFTYQWLPPFAWYFGGTEKLFVFNSEEDANFILENNLKITLDTSHFLMSSNYFEFNAEEIYSKLAGQISHIHLADAKGYDGEGFHIGFGDERNLPLLRTAMETSFPKVVEVWQGHLNMYKGFEDALEIIAGLYDE